MRPTGLVLPIVLLLTPALAAQQLSRVRVDAPQAPQLAEELEAAGFDVLEGAVRQDSLELVVSPTSWALLEQRGLEPVLLAVSRPFAEIQRERQAAAPGDVPSGYSNLAGVIARMNAAAAAHPGIAKVYDLTQTYGAPPTAEGRHVFAIKISDNVALDEDEPNVLVVGNHHAREIVTPEIVLTAMDKLVSGYGSDPAITAAVDGQEIWLAPVWNPDGYEYVFNVQDLWRKNRRVNGGGFFGVDLNRNYSFGWTNPCSGSTSIASDTYKGPAASSEPETVTMELFSEARRFAKVLDYHSSGQEVLWAYACWTHPFQTSYLRPEAIALSVASGYGGAERPPSADGEHYEWQLATYANWSFLIETHTTFQPSYASAVAEANMLWAGILFTLQRPIPLWGRVTDSVSGQPVPANVRFLGVNWQNGEKNSSGGPFGRYYGALPPGSYNVEFSSPCYQTKVLPVTLTTGGSVQLDAALVPVSSPTVYCTAKATSIPGCLPTIGFSGTPSVSAGSGFVVSAGPTPGNNPGLFIYNTNPSGAPISNAYGFLCVAGGAGLFRVGFQPSGGNTGVCNGQFAFDFNQYVATTMQDPTLVAGAQVEIQVWYRDPPNVGTANLTNAGRFGLCP